MLDALPADILLEIVHQAAGGRRVIAEENAQRLGMGHALSLVCRGTAEPANTAMYRHIHLTDPSRLRQLSAVIEDEEKYPVHTPVGDRLASCTRSITIDWGIRSHQPPELDAFIHVLEHTMNLEEFHGHGISLSMLPITVFEVLRNKAGGSLKKLCGFALYAGEYDSEKYVQMLASFQKLEYLCTGPLWLPRPSGMTLEDEVITPKNMFSSLKTLHTSFLMHSHLLQHLLQADLPNLQSIQVASWELSSLLQFLKKHGHKLRHIDTHHQHAQYFRSSGNECEGGDGVEEMFELCTVLESITVHSLQGLLSLFDSNNGHSNLHTLHLSTSSTESLWRAPHTETRPTSWPFFPVSLANCTSRAFEMQGWEKKLPALKTITMYKSGADVDEHRGQAVDIWRGILETKGVELVLI